MYVAGQARAAHKANCSPAVRLRTLLGQALTVGTGGGEAGNVSQTRRSFSDSPRQSSWGRGQTLGSGTVPWRTQPREPGATSHRPLPSRFLCGHCSRLSAPGVTVTAPQPRAGPRPSSCPRRQLGPARPGARGYARLGC